MAVIQVNDDVVVIVAVNDVSYPLQQWVNPIHNSNHNSDVTVSVLSLYQVIMLLFVVTHSRGRGQLTANYMDSLFLWDLQDQEHHQDEG